MGWGKAVWVVELGYGIGSGWWCGYEWDGLGDILEKLP